MQFLRYVLFISIVITLLVAVTIANESENNLATTTDTTTTDNTLEQEKNSDSTTDSENQKIKKKKVKDYNEWRSLKIDDVDKEWQEGDDEEELEHEHERIQKIKQKRMPKFNMNDGKSIVDAVNKNPFEFTGGAGGHMVFASLSEKQSNGNDWDKKSVDKLAAKYTALGRSGNVPAAFYNIDNKQILVNIEKPWFTQDVLRFLSTQKECVSFYVNSKTYYPKEFRDSDDDEEDEDDEL